MISGDLKKNIFSNPKGGPLCFQKRKSALVGFFLEKNPMTNKIEKFLYILEHLIPDGRDEIPTFALYHPLLPEQSPDPSRWAQEWQGKAYLSLHWCRLT